MHSWCLFYSMVDLNSVLNIYRFQPYKQYFHYRRLMYHLGYPFFVEIQYKLFISERSHVDNIQCYMLTTTRSWWQIWQLTVKRVSFANELRIHLQAWCICHTRWYIQEAWQSQSLGWARRTAHSDSRRTLGGHIGQLTVTVAEPWVGTSDNSHRLFDDSG